MTRRRLIAVALAVATAVAAGVTIASADAAVTGSAAASATASTVEDEGADCPVPALPDAGAALGGAEVYRALGAGDAITYWSDVQDGTHCANRPEWRTPLQQHIQRFLLRTGSSAGTFRISSRAAGRLSDWSDRQTPVLSDGPPQSPSPSAPVSVSPSVSPSVSRSPSPPASQSAGQGCTAVVTVQNVWDGGFVASGRVNAGGAPIPGWTVRLALPAGSAITNVWNGRLTGTSVANATWNGSLGAGASTEFGFQGTGPVSGLAATGCAAA
ncbi:cellulose binding domain-containing protein [Dactylosporangium sp. NPDC050588]|uniref:cellulose binding domain-containing protein n=1 Tax=Dactylosporangium sp. NPDC050588 TaxID=3157211 RepID=UPI0033E35352